MTLAELVAALDTFDTTHNLDQLVLIERPGQNFSIGVLHADGQPRPYEEVPGSHFDFTFHYQPSQKEDS